MKLTFLLIILSIFSLNCGSFSSKAQTSASSEVKVGNSNTNQPKSNVKANSLDISTVDFKNFSFPDLFGGKTQKTFTLKKGQFRNGKLSTDRVYTWRKSYFFDITGDGKDESVTHIIAEGCGKDCDSHSLFYVHTVENNQPKLIWKIALGSEALGGLKSVNFNNKEITLEAFGSCTLKDGLISAAYDGKDPKQILPSNYTRFVFNLSDSFFSETDKVVLAFTEKTIADYRPKISFGEPE